MTRRLTLSTALGVVLGCTGLHGGGSPAPAVDPDVRVLRVAASELSGLAAVEGGFLIAEDELVGSVLFVPDPEQPETVERASIVKLDRGRKASRPGKDALRLFPIQDFEDLASDGRARVFALGSHQPKSDEGDALGKRRSDREFLIRLAWDSEDREIRLKKGAWELYGLIDVLADALEADCLEPGGSPCVALAQTRRKVNAGLNLEGLAYDPVAEDLYVGFRGPLTGNGEALVARIPEASLEDSSAGGARVFRLDLGGNGVSSLEWDAREGRLLVLSGPVVDDPAAASQLFSLDPGSGALALEHTFPGEAVGANRRPEGVGISSDGEIWIVFDDPEGFATLERL